MYRRRCHRHHLLLQSALHLYGSPQPASSHKPPSNSAASASRTHALATTTTAPTGTGTPYRLCLRLTLALFHRRCFLSPSVHFRPEAAFRFGAGPGAGDPAERFRPSERLFLSRLLSFSPSLSLSLLSFLNRVIYSNFSPYSRQPTPDVCSLSTLWPMAVCWTGSNERRVPPPGWTLR